MELRHIQENIVRLFLRLNGYFTSGLILHSANHGHNASEIDIMGIRLPFHNQEDRIIKSCEYLQIPNNTTDIVICELKSGKQRVQVNSALRNDVGLIKKLFNWIGAFDEDEMASNLNLLQKLFINQQINSPNDFKTLIINAKSGNYSIRNIMFAIDRPCPKRNQSRFIYGQLMLDYIWLCLCSDEKRPNCSTVYDFNLWDPLLFPLINYFKNERKKTAGNMNDLYEYFKLKP